MLIERAIIFRKRRANLMRVGPSTAPPPPAALTLVEASYVDVPGTITLTFDRAIDIAALNGNEIAVDDGPFGIRWLATGAAMMLSPTTVQIELVEDGTTSGDDVTMNASATTGIVAVAPPVGGTWAGVDDLALPFP